MFNSIMWQYIKEETKVLTSMINHPNTVKQINLFSDIHALYITAHGSSYNAAYATAPILSQVAGLRVYVYTPSEFLYGEKPFDHEDKNHTLILGISQTGTSSGVLKAMQKAKQLHLTTCSLTAAEHSPIDEISDHSFLLQCGTENSNAKTKGYSATLLFLLQWAYMLGLCRKTITQEDYDLFIQQAYEEINSLPGLLQKMISWCQKNEYGANMSHVYVIGNGTHLGTAMEGMLKIMETMCIPAMYSNIMEFSHGMHRSLKPNSFLILIQTNDDKEEMEKTYTYLKNKHLNTLLIDLTKSADTDHVISLPYYATTASLFSVTMIIQIIAAFVPENNHLEPNRNANDDYTTYMRTRIEPLITAESGNKDYGA